MPLARNTPEVSIEHLYTLACRTYNTKENLSELYCMVYARLAILCVYTLQTDRDNRERANSRMYQKSEIEREFVYATREV